MAGRDEARLSASTACWAALRHNAAIDLANFSPDKPFSEVEWNDDASIGDRSQCLTKFSQTASPDELESRLPPLGRLSVRCEHYVHCEPKGLKCGGRRLAVNKPAYPVEEMLGIAKRIGLGRTLLDDETGSLHESVDDRHVNRAFLVRKDAKRQPCRVGDRAGVSAASDGEPGLVTPNRGPACDRGLGQPHCRLEARAPDDLVKL
jgi:hypothetical protein